MFGLAGLGVSSAGGVVAAQFVTGAMNPFYDTVDPSVSPAPRNEQAVVTSDASVPSEAFAAMPATYWRGDDRIAERMLPTRDDSSRWEEREEASARRSQAELDREVRAEEQRAGPVDSMTAADDQPAPAAPSGEGPPVTLPTTDAGEAPGS